MVIYGVYRERKEAGNPEADNVIASMVGKELEKLGYTVEIIKGEKIFALNKKKAELIFSMAKKPEALKLLLKIEKKGIPVVNSPRAIGHCQNREKLYNTMLENGLMLPETRKIQINEIKGNNFPFLLKKTASHGKLGDTFIVKSRDELKKAIRLLKNSGTKKIFFQKFVEGNSYKFYGVGNEIFLPSFNENSKKTKKIMSECSKLAQLVKIDIYGGDFIYSQGNNNFYIVDFNDWPSFSAIREEAAKKIADLLVSKM